jgi:hypothetical protein
MRIRAHRRDKRRFVAFGAKLYAKAVKVP